MKSSNNKIFNALMCTSNLTFMICGFILVSLGVLLLFDSERILMSRLSGPDEMHLNQPLFYYVGFGIVALGFFIIFTGLLGFWFSYLRNYYTTTSYTVILLLLLLSEFSFCVLAVFWPDLIGIDVQSGRLVRALQRNYGLPGREQFTAALDFAQTTFSCCGINGSNNYGTSWWRLQEIGRRDLVVPLTCCILNGTNDDAFLNPIVNDLSSCQALNPAKHGTARHTKGCLDMIQEWTQQQLLFLLTIMLTLIFFEICTLSSLLFGCKNNNEKISKVKNTSSILSSFTSTQTLTPHSQFIDTDFDYELGFSKKPQITDSTTVSRKS